jgi:hypothetical protein
MSISSNRLYIPYNLLLSPSLSPQAEAVLSFYLLMTDGIPRTPWDIFFPLLLQIFYPVQRNCSLGVDKVVYGSEKHRERVESDTDIKLVSD